MVHMSTLLLLVLVCANISLANGRATKQHIPIKDLENSGKTFPEVYDRTVLPLLMYIIIALINNSHQTLCETKVANVISRQPMSVVARNARGSTLQTVNCDCTTNFATACGTRAQTEAQALLTMTVLTTVPPVTVFCTAAETARCLALAAGAAPVIGPREICFLNSPLCGATNAITIVPSGTLQTCVFRQQVRCCKFTGCDAPTAIPTVIPTAGRR
ncbi:Uncharacterised protein g2699 [Pycnogonum litorale]